jgi:uncharacterized protein with HEPN domain
VRDQRERLLDILEAIERTEKYAEKGRGAFEEDELVQIWILHHLQIIGEAARSLDPAFRESFAEIPWTEIIGMRHILVHHYFEIDTEIAWSVVERDLPALKGQIQILLERWQEPE